MEWELLLGLVGLYILMLTVMFHQWIMVRRIIGLTETTKDLLISRRGVIAKRIQEREKAEEEHDP